MATLKAHGTELVRVQHSSGTCIRVLAEDRTILENWKGRGWKVRGKLRADKTEADFREGYTRNRAWVEIVAKSHEPLARRRSRQRALRVHERGF